MEAGALVQLPHALGIVVVPEGVETGPQRTALQALGYDELQGFFFAQPMPGSALMEARQESRTFRTVALNRQAVS